jgi:cytochrome c553
MVMMRPTLLTLAVVAGLAGGIGTLHPTTADARPVNYKLPDKAAEFKPGPNLDIVKNNCTACHSADYIQTQPRGPKFKKDFWQAEVNKMIKAYRAQIDETDIGKIVDYLTATY